MKSLRSFINESKGASLKDRTPDRFVKEKPTNQIRTKQIEKWNKQISSYEYNIWEFVDSDVIGNIYSDVDIDSDYDKIRARFGIVFNIEFSPENLFYVTDIKDDEINEVFKNLNSSQKNYLEKQFSLKCGIVEGGELYLEMTGPAFLYKFLQYCEKTNDYKRTIKNADGSLEVMDNSVELSFSFESTDELKKYCQLTVNIFKEALNNMCLDIWNKLTK